MSHYAHTDTLAETVDIHQYILDPLATIIRLAILSYKPSGTKLWIHGNSVQYQLPGPWQFVCRYLYANTKSDIHYLYNPIVHACRIYLTPDMIEKYPDIRQLFSLAVDGLTTLLHTYSTIPIIHLVVFYYQDIIRRAMQTAEACMDPIRPDWIGHLYSAELLEQLAKKWTDKNVQVVLQLIMFLSKDARSVTNISSLETIVDTIDAELKPLFHPVGTSLSNNNTHG